MARFAVSSELTPVNVGMTAAALGSHLRKNKPVVALPAGDCFMQPSQRVPRLLVTKVWSRPNRRPTSRCVAVLARHCQRPMGILSGAPLLLSLPHQRTRPDHQKGQQQQPRNSSCSSAINQHRVFLRHSSISYVPVMHFIAGIPEAPAHFQSWLSWVG